jgi:phosphoesterase RecJ-like protein
MPGADEIVIYKQQMKKADEFISKASYLILLDFNALSRIGEMKLSVEKSAAKRIMFDHHPFPDANVADVLVSEPSVSSTCELSFFVMETLGWAVSREAATCLYSGIMTDTGLLNHNSSRPEIYHMVARLVEKEIDKEFIHKKLFYSNSLNRTRLFGYALCNNLEILPSQRVALIALSREDLDRFNYTIGDTEGLVNQPLSIKGIDVAALFIEKERGFVKASFRSRGNLPVNSYSGKYFGGGGHKNAAGGEFNAPLNEAVNLFKKTVESFLFNTNETKEEASV